jgi:tellurium resistance protein TerZ
MAISLSKEQKISLSISKESGNGLTKVFMGLGWDPVKHNGFFGGLFGGSIDLDASCLMFNEQKELVDIVWFKQLQSRDGSIYHSGDNLTGEGDGDDEVINIDLTRIPSNVQTLVFVITSFSGQTFDKIESAFCRLVDASKNNELVRYTLSGKTPVTAQIMAKIYRENGEWMMQAIGAPTNGTVPNQIVDIVKHYL